MNRLVGRVVAILVAAAIAWLGTQFGWNEKRSPQSGERSPSRSDSKQPTRVDQPFVVTHVADGDTFDCDPDAGGPEPSVRVRILGIDAPELTGPSAELGESARRFLRSAIDRKRVRLTFDGDGKPQHDRYGRLLAYVEVEGGDPFVNGTLVAQGHAFVHRYLTCQRTHELVKLEASAANANRGVWRSVTPDRMPEWRQRWLAEGSPPPERPR